ncbi:MAG TPA: PCRF domain-containing protein, partial [Marmoricola sp.]|nr:PCRF domain-containing protein [Marmoricola sp.]
MFESAASLLAEHKELEQKLADPSVHADPTLARRLGQRYAELTAIAKAHAEWEQLVDDLTAARELAQEDAAFAEEATQLGEQVVEAEDRLRTLLIPRDPNDGKDVLLEIKSGEGGEESALFAGDLLRMYTRYAEGQGWSMQVLDATESDLGGYKSV